MNSLGLVPLVLIGSAVVFGPLTSWMAARRERSPLTWFALGVVAGIFALIVLLLAPPGRCPRCDAPVVDWPDACSTCGTSLGGVFAAEAAGPPARPRRTAMATPGPDAAVPGGVAPLPKVPPRAEPTAAAAARSVRCRRRRQRRRPDRSRSRHWSSRRFRRPAPRRRHPPARAPRSASGRRGSARPSRPRRSRCRSTRLRPRRRPCRSPRPSRW